MSFSTRSRIIIAEQSCVEWNRLPYLRIGNRELPVNFSGEVLADLAVFAIAWIS